MNDNKTQAKFLEEVRKRLSTNVSFADKLAEILDVSRDSAYRRIRGETILSLDEAKKLCNHSGVSLDAIFFPSSSVAFQHWAVDHASFTLDKWLQSILTNLSKIHSLPASELIYSAKDIPIFNYFNYPELSAFKMFFWMKTVLRYPEYQNTKFSTDIVSKEYLSLGERIWAKYASIPTTELWSEEAISATLKQIEFYHDCGFFKNPKDAESLCQQYTTLMSNLQEWATCGTKNKNGAKFTLCKNEILIGDNVILMRAGTTRTVFIAYNTMSVLTTSQESFCQHIEDYINNLLNRSILISTTGEKERSKFFNLINDRIEKIRHRIR